MSPVLNHKNIRCAQRTFVFIFIWSVIVIATVRFRHAEYNSLTDADVIEAQNEHSVHGTYKSSPYFEPNTIIKKSEINIMLNTIVTARSQKYKYEAKHFFEDDLLIDHRPPKTERELIREIENQLPSLPLSYWSKNNKFLSQRKNTKNAKSGDISCIPKYPDIFELEFNNIYWQTLRSSNGTFQLFSAFYDNRKLSRIGPSVRIIGMIDRIEPVVKTFCLLWYSEEKEPKVVEILEYKYMWYSKWGNYKQGIYQPYIIACRIPQSHLKYGSPASVSLIERICDTATNNINIIYNKPKTQKDFAVCVKGLDFLHEDLSVRLIEWIELIGILGADKIFFYKLHVHPNVSKVLNHYQKLNKVHVTPLTLPGGQPNIPTFQHMYLEKKTNHKRQNELIPYNDCLYKHMYEYRYIVLLDIDEVIMPVQDYTWQELMKRILPKALMSRNETRASYNVRNVYFLDDLLHPQRTFDDIPRYMHMLQHVYRSQNFTKPNQYIKCFHNTERVVTLHNHFPLACLGAGCSSYPIETKDAQLQHYRADCVKSLKKSCLEYRQNSLKDTTIWRYKEDLLNRVKSTLWSLGFFSYN